MCTVHVRSEIWDMECCRLTWWSILTGSDSHSTADKPSSLPTHQLMNPNCTSPLQVKVHSPQGQLQVTVYYTTIEGRAVNVSA